MPVIYDRDRATVTKNPFAQQSMLTNSNKMRQNLPGSIMAPALLNTSSRSPDDSLLDLPTAFSTLTCLQRGLCPVSSLRGSSRPRFLESHSLYYEVHGSPATAAITTHNVTEDNISPKKLKNKMVFIPGLNSSCFCWGPQVRWFGGGVPHATSGGEEEQYTVLVFDNRGVGNSGYPMGPYT